MQSNFALTLVNSMRALFSFFKVGHRDSEGLAEAQSQQVQGTWAFWMQAPRLYSRLCSSGPSGVWSADSTLFSAERRILCQPKGTAFWGRTLCGPLCSWRGLV